MKNKLIAFACSAAGSGFFLSLLCMSIALTFQSESAGWVEYGIIAFFAYLFALDLLKSVNYYNEIKDSFNE